MTISKEVKDEISICSRSVMLFKYRYLGRYKKIFMSACQEHWRWGLTEARIKGYISLVLLLIFPTWFSRAGVSLLGLKELESLLHDFSCALFTKKRGLRKTFFTNRVPYYALNELWCLQDIQIKNSFLQFVSF